MIETTPADRRRELDGLLHRISEHPERSWTDERARAAVLQRLLAADRAPG